MAVAEVSRSRVRSAVRTLAPWVITALVLAAVVALAQGLDWDAVWSALGALHVWQLAVLVLVLLLRQVFNCLPLAWFIEGCSVLRAFQNDQASTVMYAVAPPPADYVTRMAMFGSWGLSIPAATAGAVMNTLSFYVIRFGAPMLGVLVMAATGMFDTAEVVPAVLSALISVALLLAIWLGFREERLAAALGTRAARLVGRFKHGVDVDAWREAVVAFRLAAAQRIRWALPRSLLVLVAMVVTDAALIVLSIRFVGVSADELSAVPVLTAFLVAYPLTSLFFSGLGVLDAVVIATLLYHVNVDHSLEPELVAAFLIWRVVSLGVPLLMGAVSLVAWKIELVRR
ncbi:hypothetical protein [Mumia quercus]|uniref:hypothetical protein n=1 Tax=Mumia quercus TaxID=2976125 RepID=UPI0021CE4890|nr:hypothetical protein [Mumia quercus]